MFFKRIEMVGFKSFATKTVVDFIPGTTIIVGPNGCGKSNILDAIKWVLGEQSASQMRGKRMSDVIFAGSASFKSLGVAQVTLTIDNARRLLPMEYDEVQVTRRLFRSGESEYLINKSPARLRDVYNLFLGTGVGKSAYSILEQGRVDQIINAKPSERRFLIEEAAGISKFKIRKLEALRKLERTAVDLARLSDLLIEVERQTGSLKRQAAKAERYKQLFEDGRRAEQELLILRSRELAARIREYDRQLSDVGGRLTAMRTQLAEKSAAEEQARELELELADRLADQNQALFDLKNNLSECDAQITRINDKISSHQSRVHQIHSELRELDVKADELDLRLEEAEARHAQAVEAQSAHQQRHDELRLQYVQMQESVREQTQRIEALNGRLTAEREALARAEGEARTAEALIARQGQERAEIEALSATLEATRGQESERHAALRERAQALAASIEALQREIDSARQAQARRQESLAATLREMEQANKELHQAVSRLQTLKELSANYEGYYQGVREAMLAADGGQLHGIRGVVANLVRAKPEHEVAIEVALATHLQDIVTETADDAREAIFYLKNSGRGRATFLPMDRLQVSPLAGNLRQALGRPGVLGVASELVDFDPSIRVAVDFVLGQTIVVRDLDVGLDLQRAGLRARYVSLDGQLVNPGGSMTGGRVQATGLMTREREIRDLEDKVASLEKRGKKLRDRVGAIQDQMTAGRQAIEQGQSTLDATRLEHASLAKDVEAAERALAIAEAGLAERQAQLEKIQSEVADRQAAIAGWRAEAEAAAARLAEAEAALAVEHDRARASGEDIMTLGASLAEARADSEKERERAQDAQAQIEAAQRDVEGVARSRHARLKEIEDLQKEDAVLQEQIARIRQETQQHRIDFDAMTQVLGCNQAEREEVAILAKQLAGEAEVLARDERELGNSLHQVELERAELNTNLSSLAEQSVERFETTLEALGGQVGEIDKDPHALQVQVAELREKLAHVGPVNMAALEEYKEQRARLEFLQGQNADLVAAKDQLGATIRRLDDTTRKLFSETFEAARGHFVEMFRKFFNGGKADLILEAPEGQDPLLEGGVEILAQPPGKKLQNITLLSGGEKAMTAISLLFALFQVKPSPFCVLDEIDAPLDDANIVRFCQAVGDFKRRTQFVVITHNKLTMELADSIYGVTMEESGVSKVVSVRFAEAEQLAAAAV
jgi:chromosome segregation protein